jgi:hypothetical protein
VKFDYVIYVFDAPHAVKVGITRAGVEHRRADVEKAAGQPIVVVGCLVRWLVRGRPPYRGGTSHRATVPGVWVVLGRPSFGTRHGASWLLGLRLVLGVGRPALSGGSRASSQPRPGGLGIGGLGRGTVRAGVEGFLGARPGVPDLVLLGSSCLVELAGSATIAGAFACGDRNPRLLEAAVHEALRDFRTFGEWFKCPAEVAVAAVEAVITRTMLVYEESR